MTLERFLKDTYGYSAEVKASWQKYTELWKSWYRGKVKTFHSYTIYNGKRRVRMERLSLQMAKKCCEDWADLLFNERCKIALKGDDSLSQLNEVLTANDFWALINKAVEFSGASGTGAIVTSVANMTYNEDSNTLDVTQAATRLEYVDVDCIYPLSWDSKGIRECAFGVRQVVKGKSYVFLSVHTLGDNGNYVIHNHTFADNNGNLSELTGEGTSPALGEFDTQSSTPWFAILSPAGANYIAPDLPWGLPYFAQAIDVMRAIDTSYDSLNNEILLGRKRIFVRQDMLVYDDTGEHLVFDDNDLAIYCLPKGLNSEDLIQGENSDLRVDALQQDIELNLNVFSNLVGFGQNHYQFNAPAQQTATAVVSQNSAMYRRKKKHEIPLESALFDIIKAVAYASTAFGGYSIDTDGLAIQFDDSIIEDTQAMSDRALREISASVMSPVEYREKIYGEAPETAAAKIKDIKDNYPTLTQLVGE